MQSNMPMVSPSDTQRAHEIAHPTAANHPPAAKREERGAPRERLIPRAKKITLFLIVATVDYNDEIRSILVYIGFTAVLLIVLAVLCSLISRCVKFLRADSTLDSPSRRTRLARRGRGLIGSSRSINSTTH